MRRHIPHSHKVLLAITALLLVSGQLSAYPLFCSMPGMEMHSMDTMESQVTADVTELADLGGISATANQSDEHSYPDFDRLNNCEQVCGNCLNYSYSGTRIMPLIHDDRASLQRKFYSRFAPTEPSSSLFRPPIAV